MQTTFKETINRAQGISRKFAEHDANPWNAETKILDLSSHVGQLAQGVLEKEGRKKLDFAAGQIGQRIATILFILSDVAADYGIDVDQEFRDFLDRTESNLNKNKGGVNAEL